MNEDHKLTLCMENINIVPIEPVKVSIDKVYFRKKFEKILEEWIYPRVIEYDDLERVRKGLLDDLMKCFDEEKDDE